MRLDSPCLQRFGLETRSSGFVQVVRVHKVRVTRWLHVTVTNIKINYKNYIIKSISLKFSTGPHLG